MKIQNSILIGVAVLQSHIWIVFTQEVLKGISNISEDDTSALSDDETKSAKDNRLQTSLLIFIASSLLNIATSPASDMSRNYLISQNTQTSYFSGTTALVADESKSVLNFSSIQHPLINVTSTHHSHFATPHVVNVPTSYLLNSSYLLKSYNLLENSFYLLENSSNHISDVTNSLNIQSYLLPSSAISESLHLSSSYDSHVFTKSELKDTHNMPLSESNSHTPSAESRILLLKSIDQSSPTELLTTKSTKTMEEEALGAIQNSATIESKIRNKLSSVSSPVNDKIPHILESKPTASLSEKINTDFSNFLIETSIALSEYEHSIHETNEFSSFQTETVLPEVSSLTVLPTILKTDYIETIQNPTDESIKEVNENVDKGFSHEIINDDPEPKNKTFRNEDPEIDEIISGIIHLLAGNVQVARPTKHGFGMQPTRLHLPLQPSLVSTRINNRGPIRPNPFSRTVVVFSQPPNGPPTELALPGHLLPSTLQNGQFIRIIPTKVGEHPPSGVPMIHFYNQGPQHLPQPLPQPLPPQPPPLPQPPPRHGPFRGEVFNPNNRPNNNLRIPAHPNENTRPTFGNPEKTANGKPLNKFQHFIFSDEAASSVVVLRPSKPPLIETFSSTSHQTEVQTDGNSSNPNKPSQSFEVLIDNTQKKNIFVSQPDLVSQNNANSYIKKLTSNVPPLSNTLIYPTRTKDIIPHGPVTDWVPFSERPSMKEKLNDSLAADANVSIIMHPVIFDLTVSNSIKEIETSKNSTDIQNLQSIPSETEKFQNIELYTIIDTSLNPISTAETESMIFSSEILNDEYIHSNSPLGPTESIFNDTTQVPEMDLINSTRTIGIISTLSIDKTPTYDSHEPPTETLTSFSYIEISSSFSHENVFTEKRAFVENTESAKFPIKISSTTLTPTPTLSSKSIAITSSSPASEQTLLGRPIVIPVDIEEVRPFAGPINPSNSDRNRDYPYLGPFSREEGSSTEDSARKSTTTTTRTPIIRSQARPRPNTVRIDTCIVGDDTTCDVTLNETCKTEMGISSCHCRPGYARSFARGPCIPIVSLALSIKVDRFGNKKVTFTPKYLDKNSEDYRVMEFEVKVALTSLLSQIPAFARTFLGMNVNAFYPIGEKLVINSTIFLEEKESTRTQAVRLRLRQLIGEAIRNKKQNIGDSRLFVEGTFSPVTAIEDINECSDSNLNDCSEEGLCFNVFGTYLCKCRTGYVDPFVHDERKSGRKCSACSPEYCSFHGKCFVERDKRLCKCHGNYIGSRCEIDGEVLGVALGASLAAIIIILLTLGCLCIWNRKWKQQQQKAEVLSSRSYNSNQTFSYMGNVMNGSANPYHLTMEDRMRWAQISDVIKNVSVQPNPKHPYLPPTPVPLDQGTFPNRCPPNDDEVSWYECRSRPRSRAMGQYGAGPACFEMDIAGRGPYPAPSNYHSSKRHKHSSGSRY